MMVVSKHVPARLPAMCCEVDHGRPEPMVFALQDALAKSLISE